MTQGVTRIGNGLSNAGSTCSLKAKTPPAGTLVYLNTLALSMNKQKTLSSAPLALGCAMPTERPA